MSSTIGPGSASFAAYSYLTLALPLERKHEGANVNMKAGPQLSYQDFVNDITSGKTINPSFASFVPQQVIHDFQIAESVGKNPEVDSEALNWVQKAYEIGMIDPTTNMLATNLDKKA